jgi:hypothetical protein
LFVSESPGDPGFKLSTDRVDVGFRHDVGDVLEARQMSVRQM